eukprot:3480919-Alexandrium_andersonii.AAC.1
MRGLGAVGLRPKAPTTAQKCLEVFQGAHHCRAAHKFGERRFRHARPALGAYCTIVSEPLGAPD